MAGRIVDEDKERVEAMEAADLTLVRLRSRRNHRD